MHPDFLSYHFIGVMRYVNEQAYNVARWNETCSAKYYVHFFGMDTQGIVWC
jgi:hypothetical protein